MSARHQIQRLAREYAQAQPDRETCRDCRGSGRGDYGPCPECDGFGSWPASDLHERPEDQAACLHLARAQQFSSGAASPRNAGEAVAPPFATASTLSKRKAA